jgi:O-antigen/teichoic acid export membrane protein
MSFPVSPLTEGETPVGPIAPRMYASDKPSVEGITYTSSLRAKVLRGGAWLGGGSVAEQATRFARNMVLARLLAPGAFGTMAVVLSSSSVVDSLLDVGMMQAVIQNPRGGEDTYLNAAWWLAMGRAICVYVCVFAMAPWLSRFYGNAELSPLLRVALLSTLLSSAMSPRAILAVKDMSFARWAAIMNGGGICGVALTVILSFFVRDVWALAIGYCGENAFRCLLSYVIYPSFPSPKLDRTAMRDLLKFSRGVLGLSLLNLIFTRADIFVLAKLYSPAALGLYTMAVYLVLTPSGFLVNLLSQTSLPALSKVQEDKERMNRILVELTSWLILLGLPAVVFICLCGPSLLTIAYGARYATAAGALAVASVVVFVNVLNAQITFVFCAAGRPELHRRGVAATAATMLITVYPACKYLGLAGGQIAALLAIVVGYFFQVVVVRQLTNLNLFRYGRAFVRSTVVSAGVLTVCLAARFLRVATAPAANVALGIGACVIAYLFYAPALARIKETG